MLQQTDLEDIMLSEKSQVQKKKTNTIPVTGSTKDRFTQKNRTLVARGWGEGEQGMRLFNGYRVSVQDDAKVLEMAGGDRYTKI